MVCRIFWSKNLKLKWMLLNINTFIYFSKLSLMQNCRWLFHTGRSISQRRQWQATPVLLPRKSHGQRSLVGCSPWGRYESDATERLHFHFSLSRIGEGNGNPRQCSCLENPRDEGAWWAAVYGVSQSWTRLKRLSSSSSSRSISKCDFQTTCNNITWKTFWNTSFLGPALTLWTTVPWDQNWASDDFLHTLSLRNINRAWVLMDTGELFLLL